MTFIKYHVTLTLFINEANLKQQESKNWKCVAKPSV